MTIYDYLYKRTIQWNPYQTTNILVWKYLEHLLRSLQHNFVEGAK